MSLIRALFNGASGMRASQSALAVVGHNIANVDTPGFSRQRLNVANIVGFRAGPGHGVEALGISRAEDRFLQMQVLRDRHLRGFHAGQERTLAGVERLFVEGGEASVNGSLDAFFNAARELSTDPTNGAARNDFVARAQATAESFRQLRTDLRTLQEGIDADLEDRADRVNALASEVARANTAIRASEGGRARANDLRDQREEAIRELSELVGVVVLPQRDGTVNLELPGGFALVQGNQAASLQTTPRDDDGLMAVELRGLDGTTYDMSERLSKGEVGGLLKVRDTELAGRIDDLDQLAFTFVESVNAQHRAGFGADGNGGRDLFEPVADVAGAAMEVALRQELIDDPGMVAASGDPLLPSDNANLLALADLQDARHAALGNVTLGERFGQMLHAVGRAAAENTRELKFQRVRADQTEALRESVEGVSLDDELLDLTRFQKHFEANTRVISTVDALLSQVMELVR